MTLANLILGGLAMLQVFVTTGCEACDRARVLAERAAHEFEDIAVDVIDIDERPEQIPPSVFAVPSYLLNGAVISLGNPSWERLSSALSAGGAA